MIGQLRKIFIFILIFSWIFSGWPRAPFINFPPKIQQARAADISIDTGAVGQWRSLRNLVWTTPLIGYFFYVDGGDADFKYVKTTDGGQTWNAGAEIDDDATITGMMFDVWYDRWTPGDTGDLIHIWWVETADGDVNYVNLNTASSDTIGSNVIVFNGASAAAGRGVFVSGAKARGGNMLVAFDIDAGAEMGTYRSTDGGANWGARTNMVEATLDQLIMFPGNETDTQDMWALYHDADDSTNALTLKMHDDSANTNSESATIVTLVENTTDGTGQYGFSGSIRKSDGHLIAATESGYDSATGDFQVWDINGTASITEKTAIATDKDDIYYPSVYIDSADNIYVAYVGMRDGSETLGTTNGVYYTKSTDGGANWSAGDTAYSATASDWRHTWAAPSGPRFMVVWRDISAGTLLENYDNSVIATAALTGTVTASITESDIVTGGKTIILTLSGDNWVASGATFDAQRQNIINGIDSAQAEATGWDAEVKAKEVVGAVVRTSATVVTVTLTAQAGYNITATETITATIPATALVGGNAIVASPTFDITTVVSASLTFVVSTDIFPNITPGSPVFATSTLSVDTDNSAGWYVTVSRDDSDTAMDLDTDATVNIIDQTAWAPGGATTTAGNAVRVSAFGNSGDILAFRLMTASGTQSFISTDWWGTADDYADNANTLWGGLPPTAQTIGDSSVSCSGTNCALNTMLYYLDVPSTQKTGAYSGALTFTATMN